MFIFLKCVHNLWNCLYGHSYRSLLSCFCFLFKCQRTYHTVSNIATKSWQTTLHFCDTTRVVVSLISLQVLQKIKKNIFWVEKWYCGYSWWFTFLLIIRFKQFLEEPSFLYSTHAILLERVVSKVPRGSGGCSLLNLNFKVVTFLLQFVAKKQYQWYQFYNRVQIRFLFQV